MNIDLNNLAVEREEFGIKLLSVNIPHFTGYLVVDGDEIYAFESELEYGVRAYNELVDSTKKDLIPSNAEDFIKALGELYSEHRSDVSDICHEFLIGGLTPEWREWREHRFIRGNITRDYRFIYDTLTTIAEYQRITASDIDEWETAENLDYDD